MRLNNEMMEILIALLRKDSFDEKLFYQFSNLKQVKDLINHDKILNRKTSVDSLKNSLINAINGNNDDDQCYMFNDVRKNLDELEKIIQRINNQKKILTNNIFTEIEPYAPKEPFQDCTYYFYAGGIDGGFSEKSGEIYINIHNLLRSPDELEGILVHEFYHARKHPFEISDFFVFDFSQDNYLKTTFNFIFEEGIATLIQLEYRKRGEKFNNNYEYMKILSDSIEDIYSKNEPPEKSMANFFNNFDHMYVVGYWLAHTLYNHGGKETLNYWTLEYDYKKCLKIFIEESRKGKIKSGFSKEVEDYLLKHCC